MVGAALVVYGIAGIGIFAFIAIGVDRPLDRAEQLSQSVESDRQAVVQSLEQAELTLRGMSGGVDRMDASLAAAKTAIDNAAAISHSAAQSMYSLRDAMGLSILGAQPLSGLAGGFDNTGQNLDALGNNISTVGTSLDANRADVATTSQNLTPLPNRLFAMGASFTSRMARNSAASTLSLSASMG